jgi:hypothetical protein
MGIKAFMLHETDRAWRYLRRYSTAAVPCPGPYKTFHNACVRVGAVTGCRKDSEGCWESMGLEMPLRGDQRWPRKCDHCDYRFFDGDEWQVYLDHIYVTDAGAEHSIRNPPVGALWFADWTPEAWKGPDGRTLYAMTPGGQWCIDGPASNCTNREDQGPFGVAHRCWVRRGTPPNVHVDKNGHTCSAGAGSIQAGNYHGFLHNGEFTSC